MEAGRDHDRAELTACQNTLGDIDQDTENMMVVFMSVRRHIIGWEVISNGSLTERGSHHPRHNHPSGDSSPSEADIKVTRYPWAGDE